MDRIRTKGIKWLLLPLGWWRVVFRKQNRDWFGITTSTTTTTNKANGERQGEGENKRKEGRLLIHLSGERKRKRERQWEKDGERKTEREKPLKETRRWERLEPGVNVISAHRTKTSCVILLPPLTPKLHQALGLSRFPSLCFSLSLSLYLSLSTGWLPFNSPILSTFSFFVSKFFNAVDEDDRPTGRLEVNSVHRNEHLLWTRYCRFTLKINDVWWR